MDLIISIFGAAEKLSPLAVIALLVGLLYVVLYKQPTTAHTDQLHEELTNVRENDLHDLGNMAETLRRIEVAQTQAFAQILAKLNALRCEAAQR